MWLCDEQNVGAYKMFFLARNFVCEVDLSDTELKYIKKPLKTLENIKLKSHF